MKKLSTAAILVGGAILASQSAFAGYTANDLYLGFQNQAGSASSNYIINLGAASGIVGGSSVVDLSSDFSLTDFNSVLGSSSSMYAGILGGKQDSISPDVYVTQLRSSLGTPSVAGSTAPSTLTSSDKNSAMAPLGNLNGPAANSGTLDATLSWQNYVEPNNTPSTFLGASGINPDSLSAPSSVLYEDLYYAQGSSAFAYQGYLTLDITGSNPSVTFTPAAVPEPATYALFGMGGLLLFSLRRRLMSKNA